MVTEPGIDWQAAREIEALHGLAGGPSDQIIDGTRDHQATMGGRTDESDVAAIGPAHRGDARPLARGEHHDARFPGIG